MGKTTGFLEIERRDRAYEKPEIRLKSFTEFVRPLSPEELNGQAARCMDCGIPFCHNGCPVNNQIPDWNNLVYQEQWRQALVNLHSTNNFPEFTGRICPAPCEASCTLNIDDNPVTIKTIECAIVDRGWAEGWITPLPPEQRTGKTVAVVGSGPAGMACAQQLARAGHAVTLIEREDRIGGLLRYGIPDFKMEKHLIDRRVDQMAAEGVTFQTSTEVGKDVSIDVLLAEYHAVVLTGGAEWPRNLDVVGRDLEGIHYAMDFLTQQNKRDAGDDEAAAAPFGTLSARGKHVVVIGGGDTGADCIGTSARQGAASITQIEIMAKPPVHENKAMVWPDWPTKLRSSYAHDEGCERDWAVLTKSATGSNGRLEALTCVRVEWERTPDGRMTMHEVAGSDFQMKADLVLLAMGFLGPRRGSLLEQARVELDPRGNVLANTVEYRTSRDGLFTAGDMRRGQSLVVWAIREGRQCARAVDLFLMGSSTLPR
ncbi:glutamate synthase subunit beta [Rhodopila sp.]|uniref:glutamate synthase subunit beta n=1 Tax=Rhodopila sp. TaxID=2480087 RepID=UPI003D0C96A1